MNLRLTKEQWAWASVRLFLGFTLFWAFLDKTFGLGYSTASSKSWLNGGSPTTGYLGFAASGPLKGFYNGLSGNTAVDVLFMLALFAIGMATILGVGTKISGYTGALLMLLLYSTNPPYWAKSSTNPILDEHLIFLILFLAMTFVMPGKWFGLGEWWRNTSFVKRFPILE
jgi:thiosulfate dehydrogenase [quinone] large subunit